MVNWYEQIPYHVKAVIVPIHIVMICVGVIGNVMVAIVILKTKDLRNSTNIFLVNLSIADLIMVVMFGPTSLTEIINNRRTWTTGVELCKCFRFVMQMLMHVSVLTMVALSFERYYAICQPFKAVYVCTTTRAAVICALVWCLAALLASPILAMFIYQYRKMGNGTIFGVCVAPFRIFWNKLYIIVIAILIFFMPLVTLVVLFSLIAKNLMKTSAIIVQNANNTNNSSNVNRYRKRVILMLGAIIISFFICFLPREILRLPKIIDFKAAKSWFGIDGFSKLSFFAKIMPIWHAGINPILYNLMSSKFRAGFAKLLRINKLMRCCTNSRENMQSQDTLNSITTTCSRV